MALQNVTCLGEARAVDLFENGGALRLPAIGRGLEVVMREVDVDGSDQLGDAGKAAFSDDVISELAKEALHQVEPGRAGGGEVDVNAGMFCQPGADGGVLVGRVIIDDQVQGEFRRSLAMNLPEGNEPVGMRVARRGSAKDPAIEIVERSEERHRAMTRVVMSPRANMAHAQRQSGLGSLQRLTLALFIAAEDQRLGWRVEIKADDIPELGFKVRIARQLECAGQVRLDLVGRPEALHARRRNADLSRHRTNAPASPVGRGLRRQRKNLFLLCVRDRRLRPTTRRLLESRQSQAGKAALPTDHRRSAHADLGGRRLLTATRRTQQHDARPDHEPLLRGRGINHAFQLAALVAGNVQSFDWSAHAKQSNHRNYVLSHH